jgi:hypothetical protein
MNGKITLITPPDIFENGNISLLFVNLSEQDQDAVSKWLSDANIDENINIYFYNGEPNVTWFFHAIGSCEHKYIDLDGNNYVTSALSGYVLGKNNFVYKTTDENIAAVYSHINSNRVRQIEEFLERALSGQTT